MSVLSIAEYSKGEVKCVMDEKYINVFADVGFGSCTSVLLNQCAIEELASIVNIASDGPFVKRIFVVYWLNDTICNSQHKASYVYDLLIHSVQKSELGEVSLNTICILYTDKDKMNANKIHQLINRTMIWFLL